MIVAVIGGRRYHNRGAVFMRLATIHASSPITEIWHGAAGWDRDETRPDSELRGLDALADSWAQLNGVQVRRFPAAWGKYGPRAGADRTREMFGLLHEQSSPKKVVIFAGGGPVPSHAFRAAEAMSLPTEFVRERP